MNATDVKTNRPAYMPLGNGETLHIQFLHSLYEVLKENEALKPRMSMIGKWWRYRGLLTQLHNLFGEMWNTIDPVTQEKLNAAFSRQELRIATVGDIDITGDKLVIPRRAVVLLSKELQEEKCAICMGGHNERKDCQFRKALRLMSIPDIRRNEKYFGKCIGQIYSWEE